MWPDFSCGCKCWFSVLVRPRTVTSLPLTSVSSTGKWGLPCLLGELTWAPMVRVHLQCQGVCLGHSLPRLFSQEVKMMTSKLSCGFDVCYVSNVVVWSSSRHQIGAGRLESTNVFSGLLEDLNGRSWLTLASIKIKTRSEKCIWTEIFVARRTSGILGSRHYNNTLSHPLCTASFSSELCQNICI